MSRNHCNRCGCKTTSCGCDHPLVTTSGDYCSGPPRCSEYIETGCILYSGPDILLYNITNGMPLNEVIGKLLLAVVSPGCVLQDPLPDAEGVCFITVDGVTTTTISISWPLVAPALTYTVYHRVLNTGLFVASSALSSTTSSYTLTGLTTGTVYEIYITAIAATNQCDSLVFEISTL